MKKANIAIENEVNTATENESGINPDATVDEVKAVKPKKERPKLDRNRPFGEISGEMEDFPGARYAQDGNLYDSNDNKLNG